MKRMWLMYDGSIWYEDLLRQGGWTDTHLRAPYACRVRERVPDVNYSRCVQVDVAIEPTVRDTVFKPTHIYVGYVPDKKGQQVEVNNITDSLLVATFRDGSAIRILTTEVEPISDERDELIDDIDALCLSIEKRQNELSRLVKKLKG